MSRLVVAGAWTIETNHTYEDVLGSQPVSDRLTYLKEVLTNFDKSCRAASGWKYYAQRELYVFVAPEYYFKSKQCERGALKLKAAPTRPGPSAMRSLANRSRVQTPRTGV
jgi:hypothetical protein